MKWKLNQFIYWINLLLIFLFSINKMNSQEFKVNVKINANKLNTTVNKEIFTNLESQLKNLLENQKWTNDIFKSFELINCSFFLTLQTAKPNDVYSGNLSIIVSRPVYNSSYQSSLINYIDREVTFKYRAGDLIQFNDLNFRGGDPLVSNISAIYAFWSQIILGIYYNTFKLQAGNNFFIKAQQIVNNAPTDPQITGWLQNDGFKNRYWLSENLLNQKYNAYQKFLYNFYRQGLDDFWQNPTEAKTKILSSLGILYLLQNQFVGLPLISLLIDGKVEELGGVFKNSDKEQKSKFIEIMEKVDVLNINKYKNLIDF